MKTFYFNTGVKRYGNLRPIPLCRGQVWSSNDVKLIPFDCDNVPEGYKFKFGCDYPDLRQSRNPNFIVREIHNSTLISKYAYFEKGIA